MVGTGTLPPTRGHRLVSWWQARPTLAAVVIYALLSVLMVGQGLLPGRVLSASDFLWNDAPWESSRPASVPGIGANFEEADTSLQFQPFLHYTRSQLPHIPLWNPYISGGRPFLADAQSAIFSPFSLPAYILSFWRSLAVIAVLKLFFAALGAYALGRSLGMRFGGALLSGLVFAFGTFFIVLLPWPETNIWPLIPWMLLLADRVIRRPRALLPAAGLAALVALTYLGGHPETSFHVLFAVIVYYVYRLLTWMRRERAGPRILLAPSVTFSLALIGGTAIAALMLVPFAELLFHSSDYARRLSAGPDFWPRKYLGALFLHDYWGRATQNSNIDPFMQLRGWYAGALTLMLAPAALLIRPTRTRIGVALFAVFTVMVVVGIPPVSSVITRLPGFNSSHNEPMLIFFLLCAALLAGWGLDELSARRPLQVPRGGLVLATSVAVFCVPFVLMAGTHKLTTRGLGTALDVAWGFARPPAVSSATSSAAGIVRMSSLLQWIPLAGIGLVLIALRLRRPRRLPVAAFVAAALILLTVDLFRANMGFNPAIPRRNAVVPTTPAIRYLQSQRPNRFVGVSTSTAFEPLPSNVSMDFGLYDARGYDYPVEQRYDTLWRRYVSNAPTLSQPTELASDTPSSLRALNLLSVSDFLYDPLLPVSKPGLKLAYRGHDALIYHNPSALPRVFLASSQHTVTGANAALVASTAAGFDARHVAVTEHAVQGLAQDTAGVRPSAGRARLVSYGAEQIVAEASATQPSLLVLTDVYYPGWKVTIDGHPVQSQRVDYLLRGVLIPPGTHRVEYRYDPASFRVGWVISLVGTLAVLAAALLGWREHWRRHGRAGPA